MARLSAGLMRTAGHKPGVTRIERTRTMNEQKPYANQHGYTDTFPFRVIRVVSEKCLDVQAMNAVLDPTWKPEWQAGGFSGTVLNNRQQRWIITDNPDGVIRRIRKHKSSSWQDAYGRRYYLSDQPVMFHDYNF